MRSAISALTAALVLVLLPATSHAQAPESAAAVSAVKGLVVSTNSWGKLRLGMTAKQAQATGMVSKQLDHCAPGYQMVKKYQRRGFVVWKGDLPAVKVDQIVITGAREHTSRNIHIGSTLRQLRKAYPKLSKVYSASELNGGHRAGDDLYVAFSPKVHHGLIGFQFAYGKRPTAGSKIQNLVISPRRTVFFGC